MPIHDKRDPDKIMNGRSGEKGVTIVELIVSMILFMAITGVMLGLLNAAKLSRSTIDNQTQLTKGARMGLNLLGRDTYNAGYGYPVDSSVRVPDTKLSALLGTPPDANATRDKVPPIIAGDELNVNNFNTTAGTMTDQVTFMFRDMTFNVTSGISEPLNINAVTTDLATGIDEVIPLSGSNAGCNINDVFLVTGNNGSTIAVVTDRPGADKLQFSNDDILDFNLTGATGPLTAIQTPGSMIRVRMVTYFVTADGVLTRREHGNDSTLLTARPFTDSPLVYGVENLQIQYYMDNGDLLDSPPSENLEKVRQVRFTIGVRTNELGPDGEPIRITQTSTFSTRNIGYDAN